MTDLTNIKVDPAKLIAARGERQQVEVAKAIGISKQRLWNYEAGLYSVPGEVLARLCLLYKVSVEQIVTKAQRNRNKSTSALDCTA